MSNLECALWLRNTTPVEFVRGRLSIAFVGVIHESFIEVPEFIRVRMQSDLRALDKEA